MGYDYSNHHVFTGKENPLVVRDKILEQVRKVSGQRLKNEKGARRSIVVGPPERWIFIGDSAGSTERSDRAGFDGLSMLLSEIAPTVDIIFSDSSVVQLRLYEKGECRDTFANGRLPIYRFRTEEDARPFAGKLERWHGFLLNSGDAPRLRAAWDQRGEAEQIIADTAELFGMDPDLASVGYSIFDESDEIRYDALLSPNAYARGAFEEFHFA